jgi:hypothetical protein
MKNPKPKQATPTKTGARDLKPCSLKEKPLVLECASYARNPEDWPRPTELQLAGLAARLARTEKIEPKQLVREAWEVYMESCQKLCDDHRNLQRRHRLEEAEIDAMDAAAAGLPMPKKYPVTFQEMELLLLPKLVGRTAERAMLFREYIFATLVSWDCDTPFHNVSPDYWDSPMHELDELRENASEQVAQTFGQWRKKLYDALEYAEFAARFLMWYATWTDHRNSDAKAANARKGWAKRRAKKTTKTGAKPQTKALREILEGPPPRKPPPGA